MIDNLYINGLKLVCSDYYMTTTGEPYHVKRTMFQRLFTRPWKPWKKYRVIVPQIPRQDVIVTDRMIVGHPQTIQFIKDNIDSDGDKASGALGMLERVATNHRQQEERST